MLELVGALVVLDDALLAERARVLFLVDEGFLVAGARPFDRGLELVSDSSLNES